MSGPGRFALALLLAASCGDDEVVFDATPSRADGDPAQPDGPPGPGPDGPPTPDGDADPARPDGPPTPDADPARPDGPPTPDAEPGQPDGAVAPDAAPVAVTCPVVGEPALERVPVATGFSQPVQILTAPGDDRLYVVEQPGRIRIMADGAPLNPAFLDIDPIVMGGGEQGLLGVAFHPDYATTRRFFVYYTNTSGNNEVAEYQASAADPDLADPLTRVDLFTISHPTHANHNGGWLGFGPDDFLYVSTGDGGGGGDPDEHGQATDTMLGKLLRLDVDGAAPYEAAAGNPFIGVDGLDEIWAYGLRNPWRASFDRVTGDLYIGDVGQGQWEELDALPAGTAGGTNFGWDDYEGDACYDPDPGPCDPAGKVFPIHTYPHDGESKSVTGGFVYRGPCMPGHQGKYFYADYYGEVASLRWTGVLPVTEHEAWPSLSGVFISAFGEDADGEIYIAGHQNGTIYRIVPAGVTP